MYSDYYFIFTAIQVTCSDVNFSYFFYKFFFYFMIPRYHILKRKMLNENNNNITNIGKYLMCKIKTST